MSGNLKLGVVGLDGHGPVFIDEINGDSGKTMGAEVTTAMPVPSTMISNEQLQANTEKTASQGVKIVDSPDDLAANVDGILILHDDGSEHLELAKLFAAKGKPVFVDKPIEVTAAKVRELVKLYRQHNCPLFSASALRYTPEIKAAKADIDSGSILSVMTWSPFMQNPRMPGWIYYAIHAVEPLFELMGPGCTKVRCIPGRYGPTAIGEWSDGRTGIAKAMAGGVHGYGFTVWREKNTVTTTVAMDTIYRGLLEAIINFFLTGVAPTPVEEEVEIISFMEQANLNLDE